MNTMTLVDTMSLVQPSMHGFQHGRTTSVASTVPPLASRHDLGCHGPVTETQGETRTMLRVVGSRFAEVDALHLAGSRSGVEIAKVHPASSQPCIV